MGREVNDRQCRGLLEGHPSRHLGDVPLGHDEDVGVSAKVRHREDTVALGQARDALADLVDGAAHLVTDHAGDLRGVGIQPHTCQQVREVDARSLHADTHLSFARFGIRCLAHLQHLGSAPLGDPDLPHGRGR